MNMFTVNNKCIRMKSFSSKKNVEMLKVNTDINNTI